jgi:hypothetical protein
LPIWIVDVDFCVSMLCCWVLTPSAQVKLIAAKTTVRLSLTSQTRISV